MTETVHIVINENDVVRSTGGYRHEPISELSLHDLVTNFAFPKQETAEGKVSYVNSFERYAPGEEYHNIASDREKRMGERAKQNYHVEEIELDYSINR